MSYEYAVSPCDSCDSPEAGSCGAETEAFLEALQVDRASPCYQFVTGDRCGASQRLSLKHD